MPRPHRHRDRGTMVILGAVVVALALVAGLAVALSRAGGNGVAPTATAGSIGVVDVDTGEFVASVAVGRSIAGITSDDDHVFATDPSGGVLVQIDPRRREVVRSFALEGEPWRPTAAASSVFVPIGAGRTAGSQSSSRRCCGIPASSARTSDSR